jgi:hypothetical protein
MPFDGTKFAASTMDDKVLGVLRQARTEISKPGKWCKGTETIYHDGLLDARCTYGWVFACSNRNTALTMHCMRALDQHLPGSFRVTKKTLHNRVVGFNDLVRTTQGSIVRLFDRAIAALAEREHTVS